MLSWQKVFFFLLLSPRNLVQFFSYFYKPETSSVTLPHIHLQAQETARGGGVKEGEGEKATGR